MKSILCNGRKRTIRIKITDCGSGLQTREHYIYKALSKYYDVELSDEPEYLFAHVFGHDSLNYDCIKIQFNEENLCPDFNNFDYAIGFDHLCFGDRYARIPLYAFYDIEKAMKPLSASPDTLLNREFCSFVVSNNSCAHPMRERFFRELSKYKLVASGGRFLNNIGEPKGVADKLAFIGKYKFNIAFENSAHPGYTTEKIMEPLKVNSVPVYWGNPLVDLDFNPQCFVHLKNEADIQSRIDEIIRLDNDPDAYLKKCFAPREPENVLISGVQYVREFEQFLCHIIDQPYEQARRICRFGWQYKARRRQKREQKTLMILRNILHPWRLLRNVGSERF